MAVPGRWVVVALSPRGSSGDRVRTDQGDFEVETDERDGEGRGRIKAWGIELNVEDDQSAPVS